MEETTHVAAPTEDDYRLAVGILVGLVRAEFPSSHSLAEVAQVWGNATPEEVEALRRIEVLLQG